MSWAIAARREMHAYAARTPYRNDRVGHLEHQPRAVFDRTAVLIGALVAAVLQGFDPARQP